MLQLKKAKNIYAKNGVDDIYNVHRVLKKTSTKKIETGCQRRKVTFCYFFAKKVSFRMPS